jgi:hypothetical protein
MSSRDAVATDADWQTGRQGDVLDGSSSSMLDANSGGEAAFL